MLRQILSESSVVYFLQMASLTGGTAPVTAQAAPAPAPADDACLAGGDDGCLNPELAQNLRVAAVFIILASSTLGIWLPVIAGELLMIS